MILRTLLLGALASLPLAPSAEAVTIGTGTPETFLGCPAGFGMITLPDPRGLSNPTTLSAPRAEQLLVVQCVSQQVAAPPACPSGMVRSALAGRDVCNQPPRQSTTPAMADGTVNAIGTSSPGISDGTSNTVSVGEAAPPATNQASTAAKSAGRSFSSVPQTVYPTCIAPAAIVTDPAGQPGDTCVIRTVALPADRVTVVR